MKKIVLAIAAAGLMAGCSAISGSYQQQSAFPSEATLAADCSMGLAKTPPVRDNACDMVDILSNFCVAQSTLPVTMGAQQACMLAGFAISGTPVKM